MAFSRRVLARAVALACGTETLDDTTSADPHRLELAKSMAAGLVQVPRQHKIDEKQARLTGAEDFARLVETMAQRLKITVAPALPRRGSAGWSR